MLGKYTFRKHFFRLSTNSVDNFVDKALLTAGNPRFHAASNKLLILKAKKIFFKINQLTMNKNIGEKFFHQKVIALYKLPGKLIV